VSRVARWYIFKQKIQIWEKIKSALSTMWYIFWSFWYIFSRIGILYQEKSGNPGCESSIILKGCLCLCRRLIYDLINMLNRTFIIKSFSPLQFILWVSYRMLLQYGGYVVLKKQNFKIFLHFYWPGAKDCCYVTYCRFFTEWH
jgi:hypothetical protein